jgi:uncharacterized protein YacL
MWVFRIVYSAVILAVFVLLRNQFGLDVPYAVTYAIGVILAVNLTEIFISDIKSFRVISAAIGGIVFLLIGYVITITLDSFFVNDVVKLGFYFIIAYVGVIVGYKNYSILEAIFSKVPKRQTKTKWVVIPKVLDTSTLIDGRIVGIVDSELLEGKLIIPTFILKELQNIADSHDHLRRQKGRRGLSVLKRLQEQQHIPVEIDDTDFSDIGTVDDKLVALAKKLKAKIITTDFNLIKVAEIQDIKVLNINTLTIALRQTVLPGEIIEITVVKEGKDHSQGVGYLEDGTMVVVENGRKLIGTTLKVEVTSVLQTDSGRIIFTKQKQ